MFRFAAVQPGIGYMAFPPQKEPSEPPLEHQDPIPESDTSRCREDERFCTLEELIAEIEQNHLLEAEERERRKGEEEWVRTGGVLRDKHGRRDMVRTRAIREELALREKEKQILARWSQYLARWDSILVSQEPLGFDDFPWPILAKPFRKVSPQDLDSNRKIHDFFLEPLSVRSWATSKRTMARSSLTRWHPDKIGSLMARVREEDKARVHAGITQVVMALHELLVSKN